MRRCASILTVFAVFASAPPAEAEHVVTADPRVKARLAPLLEALKAAEDPDVRRIVRVAWWGDSAIVGDGYTGRLRARLQQRFGDAGPGFVLPETTFEGYLRDGVRLKRNGWAASNIIQGALKSGLYGYGGIQATSFGGASCTFESRGAPFDAVHVFYRAFPKAGGLQIFVDDANNATATEDANADAQVDRVWSWSVPSPGANTVRVRAAGGGQTVLYGVALERGDNGVVIDALGLLGMRARRWLNADAAHLERQIALRAPDLLVLAFGGNERVDPGLTATRHKDDIVATMRALRKGAPKAACLVVGPLAHGVQKGARIVLDPNLTPIYEGQRAAADELGCAFFDTVEAMGGDESVAQFRKARLIAGDLAHLNGAGHRKVGDLMADWLLGVYDAWSNPAPEDSASSLD